MDPDLPWFQFSFEDFSFAFLSILLEGAPFLLLGTLISGFIDQYLPARLMTRILPRNPYAGILVSGTLGVIFPMCECGVVPVIRRLIAKGLPLSYGVTYMLAAPIVNVIVGVSTFAAFRGQFPAEMTSLRLGVGYFVAVLAGLASLVLAVPLPDR
ncbi:MAG: permease, partial [Chthoniobacterales bacterium]